MANLEIYMFSFALTCYVMAFGLYCVSSGFKTDKTYARARLANYVGLAVAFLAIGLRWHNAGHAPLSNMYESLVVLSTFIVLIGLVFTAKEKMPFVEASSDVFAVIILGVSSLFPSTIKPLIPALQSYWLPLHVSLAFLGESCFAIAVILSYFYCYKRLLNEDSFSGTSVWEKRICVFVSSYLPVLVVVLLAALSIYLYSQPLTSSKGTKLGCVTLVLAVLLAVFKTCFAKKASELLPDAEKLDELIYSSIKIGYPLFTVGGLVFGMIWANKAWGRYWGWDPKETWALVTFLVYSIYLHVRIVMGKNGVMPAFLAIVGFFVTMFTLFGVNFLISGLHSYA